MGIMVAKNSEDKSELNRRISSDLRARAVNTNIYDDDEYDEVSERDEHKKTSRFAWIWIILIVLAIISLICIIFI